MQGMALCYTSYVFPQMAFNTFKFLRPVFIIDQALLLSDELKMDEIVAIEYLITSAEQVRSHY
jgi:hypothetical protein